jgi:hypothetical protein
MKKFLLSLVFISLSFINIEATPVKTLGNVNFGNVPSMEILSDSLEMNRPIYRYLELNNDQKPMFNDIHNDLYRSIQYLNENKELASKDFKMHLNHDLYMSQLVLTKHQYHRYLRIINVTLQNKGLIKYTQEN